jgi:hypothetical protein
LNPLCPSTTGGVQRGRREGRAKRRGDDEDGATWQSLTANLMGSVSSGHTDSYSETHENTPFGFPFVFYRIQSTFWRGKASSIREPRCPIKFWNCVFRIGREWVEKTKNRAISLHSLEHFSKTQLFLETVGWTESSYKVRQDQLMKCMRILHFLQFLWYFLTVSPHRGPFSRENEEPKKMCLKFLENSC